MIKKPCLSQKALKLLKKKNASTGNWTRVTTMATLYSTTKPLMLGNSTAYLKLFIYHGFSQREYLIWFLKCLLFSRNNGFLFFFLLFEKMKLRSHNQSSFILAYWVAKFAKSNYQQEFSNSMIFFLLLFLLCNNQNFSLQNLLESDALWRSQMDFCFGFNYAYCSLFFQKSSK